MGYNAATLHGGKGQEQREHALSGLKHNNLAMYCINLKKTSFLSGKFAKPERQNRSVFIFQVLRLVTRTF